MQRTFLFLLTIFLWTSLACQAVTIHVPSAGGETPSGNSGSSSSGNAGNVSGSSASNADLWFYDDFSSPSSGWDSIRDTIGMTDYDQGGYRIQVNEPSNDYWGNPGLWLTDAIITVEARKYGGPEDNDFGIICRYVDMDHYYAFLASSDGYYAITKVDGAVAEPLGQDQLLPTSAIQPGTNTLRASCVGSTLTFFINGTQVASVEDFSFSGGDVGLIAGTFAEPGTDMLFDNFAVQKP